MAGSLETAGPPVSSLVAPLASHLRNGCLAHATLTRLMSSVFSQDSLAAEIEGTMRKELQLEEPESPDITYGCMASMFQVPTN